ncbi:CobW family GTP-binding protein [Marinobacter caseinilyticus]|uniref:CobW family GTP-binding protein n=1 Tax=Marinobacter caseinilyticus TaxID=2692195 RepID=UPI001408C585|nr:GTP-binding protein [Marinobacter caseinilyticus]
MIRSAIPTHLVLGFLGAGKTTSILHLLSQKPEHETWAVLVNEFGEVGIDGALLAGQGAVISEIPGGCMCCVAGVPMQVGLNRLIAEAKPDRLFIEPTGLGHPAQVINTLTGEFYAGVLALKTAVCLVDPRRLDDPRVRENRQFQDQVAVADLLIANKTDVASPVQLRAFDDWAATWQPAKRLVAHTHHGQVDLAWLLDDFGKRASRFPLSHQHPAAASAMTKEALSVELKPWQCIASQGEGYTSVGWRIHPARVFDAERLFNLAHDARLERVKGVVRTTVGWLSVNAVDGAVTLLDAPAGSESRLEIISPALDVSVLDKHLYASLVSTTNGQHP